MQCLVKVLFGVWLGLGLGFVRISYRVGVRLGLEFTSVKCSVRFSVRSSSEFGSFWGSVRDSVKFGFGYKVRLFSFGWFELNLFKSN